MNRKRIAVLLNGPIANDYRVIKVISVLSKRHSVELFYVKGDPEIDKYNFNQNVKLHNFIFEKSFLKRVLRHSLFCYEFNFFIKEVLSHEKFDFVWANDLPTLYPAYKIASKLDVKFIYDSHEIYLETINQFFPRDAKGGKAVIFKMIVLIMKIHGKIIEKKIAPKCDVMVTVNESIMSYFKSEYNLFSVDVLMNFPRTKNIVKAVDYRQKYNWTKKDKLFLYQGVLNEGRGLNILLSTMKNTPKDYKLIVIGRGVLKKGMIAYVKKNNLSSVIKFIDKVSLEELPKYTKGADFGINLLEEINLSKKMASPNKLFEYIHAGIPVLCTNTFENNKVLDKYKVGVPVENSIEDILNGMNTLVNEFKLNNDDFEKAKNYYCWENQENKLLEWFSI